MPYLFTLPKAQVLHFYINLSPPFCLWSNILELCLISVDLGTENTFEKKETKQMPVTTAWEFSIFPSFFFFYSIIPTFAVTATWCNRQCLHRLASISSALLQKVHMCWGPWTASNFRVSFFVYIFTFSLLNRACLLLFFILFSCLFLSLWPFQLHFILWFLPTTVRFLTLFFRSYFCLTDPFNYLSLYQNLPQPWYNPLWLTWLKAPTN